MKTLGQHIRELRAAKDLSLREFAEKLGGLSAAFLSDVELGRRYPSEKVRADMAKILGTTVDDLCKYDMRPVVEDVKRLANTDPAFGFAFRQVIDHGVSAEELLKLAKAKSHSKKRA